MVIMRDTMIFMGIELFILQKFNPCFFESVVVELKAISRLSGKEESQIMNYLKATDLTTGLLLNFGSESLEYKRFIFNQTSVKSA